MMVRYLLVSFMVLMLGSAAAAQRSFNFNPELKPFYHGVASGDPLTDRVIIWTRVTPESDFTGIAAVSWRMALDTSMLYIVQSGTVETDASKDYTVKVDVAGLMPNTCYYYEFSYADRNSIRGRTRTAPLEMLDSMRFAVVSCANYEAGFFNVYKVISQRNDIDALLHLGDYIYEQQSGGYAPNPVAGRKWQPANELISLSDYRTRYSCYKLDEDLIRLHQQFPFIMIWDDHESANDSWKDGASNHNSGEGKWVDRKASSQQAYMEWLPIRQVHPGDNSLIYRRIKFGPLCEFFMLDTRLHGREQQAGTTGPVVNDPDRTMLGNDQYAWLTEGLSATSSRWKVLGQQVMMAPLKIAGVGVNDDQWDGYPAERSKLIRYVLENNINDLVVLTGDIHTAWGNDVPAKHYKPDGTGSAFVEFVTTSVTSPGFPMTVGGGALKLFNPHVKYVDLIRKGFLILDLNMQRAQCEWYFVSTISVPSNEVEFGDAWFENNGERFLRHAEKESVPRSTLGYAPAPPAPRIYAADSSGTVPASGDLLLGIYPAPATDGITVQWTNTKTADLLIEVSDASGNMQCRKQYEALSPDVHFLPAEFMTARGETYLLKLTSGEASGSYKIMIGE